MDLHQLMLSAILFLAASLAFVAVSKALRLGAIFGLLAAGVAIGPHSPGPVLTTHVDELLGIGELGVVLLMFTIGLEMQPSRLWAMRRYLFALGPLQVLLTGAALALALPAAAAALAGAALSTGADVALGFGLALSSTAIVMQLLSEKGDVATEHGKAVFAVLVVQDVASVLLLILIPFLALADSGPREDTPIWLEAALLVAVPAGIALGGRHLLPRLFDATARRRSIAALGVILMVAVLSAAVAAEAAGLSMAMGTFLLGVMLSASGYRTQLEAHLSTLKSVSLALFFVAVGMSIDIELVASSGARLAAYAALVVALKIAATALLGLAFGLGRGGALKAAFLLAPCSEFGFVLFAAARGGGLMSDEAFAMAVATVAVSMAVTPLTTALGYRLADRAARGPAQGVPAPAAPLDELSNHVVVVGLSRAGRLMCLMLEKTETPYVAFDLTPRRVARARAAGMNVEYGDVTDPAMHGAAAFARARSVVVTLEDFGAAERLVDELRAFYPEVAVQVAAPDLAGQDSMRAKGVADAVCWHTEGELELGELMLLRAGVAKPDVDSLLETLRDDDYALLRKAMAS